MKAPKEIIQNPSTLDEIIKKLQDPVRGNTIKWLDGTDVKTLLRISDSTLWRYRKNNCIPYTKVGNKFVYPETYFTRSLVERMENAHLI